MEKKMIDSGPYMAYIAQIMNQVKTSQTQVTRAFDS